MDHWTNVRKLTIGFCIDSTFGSCFWYGFMAFILFGHQFGGPCFNSGRWYSFRDYTSDLFVPFRNHEIHKDFPPCQHLCTSSSHVFTNSVTTTLRVFFSKFYLFTFYKVIFFCLRSNYEKNANVTVHVNKKDTMESLKERKEYFVETKS